jgi:hypothetical protein
MSGRSIQFVETIPPLRLLGQTVLRRGSECKKTIEQKAMEFSHYIEVSVTVARLNVLTDRPVGEEILHILQTLDLDLHSDLEVMSFFQEDMRVSNDMIGDFDRFVDDLSYKFAKTELFDGAGHRDGLDAKKKFDLLRSDKLVISAVIMESVCKRL